MLHNLFSPLSIGKSLNTCAEPLPNLRKGRVGKGTRTRQIVTVAYMEMPIPLRTRRLETELLGNSDDSKCPQVSPPHFVPSQKRFGVAWNTSALVKYSTPVATVMVASASLTLPPPLMGLALVGNKTRL